MTSERVKSLFYILLGPFMKASGALYRKLRAPEGSEAVKVHLGPGQEKYLEGWINVDANFLTAKVDVWADLKNKLPFRDSSVDVFYSHHVIEHLPDKLLPFHFREIYRCLKPGGVFRVGGPNGHAAMKKYFQGDKEWFHDFPDERESVGGKLANFILCRNKHFTILTPSYLDEISSKAGFPDISICEPKKETNYPELIGEEVLNQEIGHEYSEVKSTLVVEGQKPERPQ